MSPWCTFWGFVGCWKSSSRIKWKTHWDGFPSANTQCLRCRFNLPNWEECFLWGCESSHQVCFQKFCFIHAFSARCFQVSSVPCLLCPLVCRQLLQLFWLLDLSNKGMLLKGHWEAFWVTQMRMLSPMILSGIQGTSLFELTISFFKLFPGLQGLLVFWGFVSWQVKHIWCQGRDWVECIFHEAHFLVRQWMGLQVSLFIPSDVDKWKRQSSNASTNRFI